MSIRWSRLALLVLLLSAPGSITFAQTPAATPVLSPWTIGVSPGLWNHVPTSEDRRNGVALDACVERRIGSVPAAVRVELGTGQGTGPAEPGFNYTRVLAGLVREISSASRAPFTVYLSGGAGAYAVRSQKGRQIEPSVYGALGLDARLGNSPLSIDAEIQVHSIGDGAYGTTSIGLKAHFD